MDSAWPGSRFRNRGARAGSRADLAALVRLHDARRCRVLHQRRELRTVARRQRFGDLLDDRRLECRWWARRRRGLSGQCAGPVQQLLLAPPSSTALRVDVADAESPPASASTMQQHAAVFTRPMRGLSIAQRRKDLAPAARRPCRGEPLRTRRARDVGIARRECRVAQRFDQRAQHGGLAHAVGRCRPGTLCDLQRDVVQRRDVHVA